MRPVLLTRPAERIGASAAARRAAGATVLELPLIEIRPLDASAARERLAAAPGYDWAVFTSPAAASLALDWHPRPWPARLAAVGTGTAALLATRGLGPVLQPPTGSGGAALLARPELERLDGQRVLILGGVGGRRDLDRGLRQRGAQLRRMALYRRQALPITAARFRPLVAQAPVLVLSSAEILRHWVALASRHSCPPALELPLVVPAERVVKLAARLGFTQKPWVPRRMHDADLVDLLRDKGILQIPGS